MPSRRRLARVAAMQAIFEMQMREIDPEISLELNIKECGGNEKVDVEYAKTLLVGAKKDWDNIQSVIQSYAPQWPLDRMDSITRAILMVGAFELVYVKDAPPPVVMNEAIEISKEYGTEESAKFVNGILNALAHRTGKEGNETKE